MGDVLEDIAVYLGLRSLLSILFPCGTGARMEQTENTAKLCQKYSVYSIYHAANF